MIDENKREFALGQRPNEISQAARQDQQETVYHPFCKVSYVACLLAGNAVGGVLNKVEVCQTQFSIDHSDYFSNLTGARKHA